MKSHVSPSIAVLTVVLVMTVASSSARASSCSSARAAGNWGYTYSGTIFTPGGAVPVAAVGHFHQDAAGNIIGSQTRSVPGSAAVEDISGTSTVNRNCTANVTINVLVNGQLQRTAVLASVFDSEQNHLRFIFASLTLPDGMNVPLVVTGDANKMSD